MISIDKTDVYSKEAGRVGLILLNLFRENNVIKGVYQYTACGHTVVKHVSNVRHKKVNNDGIGKFVCQECKTSEYNSTANRLGMTLLGHVSGADYKYKVDACGHIVITGHHNLIGRYTYSCAECEKEETQKSLEASGLEFVTDVLPEDFNLTLPEKYGVYKCLSRGHEFTFLKWKVKHVKVSCKECVEEDFIQSLPAKGLIFNHKSTQERKSQTWYGNFTFISCGHSRDISRDAVRRNNFFCHECNTTFTKQPSNIYLFRIFSSSVEFLKLGYGKEIRNRVREYKLSEGYSAELLDFAPVATGAIARKVEDTIHSKYKLSRLCSNYTRTILTRTGYSECYPMIMLNTLLDEIATIKKEGAND